MNNIILIGLPYSGKTTIAQSLSKFLNLKIYDIDNSISNKQRLSITDIFNKFNESYFRELETEELKYALTLDNYIIDCGGGIVDKEINRELLINSNNYIIYIKRDFNLINFDDNRPICRNINQLNNLYNKRHSFYESLATFCIENNGSIDECVKQIVKELSK